MMWKCNGLVLMKREYARNEYLSFLGNEHRVSFLKEESELFFFPLFFRIFLSAFLLKVI